MTTSLMHSSVSIGCGFQSEYSTSWLFWRTKCYMETHRVTFDSIVCVTDMPATAWSTDTSFCWFSLSCGATSESVNLLSAVEPFQWLLRSCGTACLTTSYQLNLFLVWAATQTFKFFSSSSPFLMSFCDGTIFHCDTLSGPGIRYILRPLYKFSDWLSDWLIWVCWNQINRSDGMYFAQ